MITDTIDIVKINIDGIILNIVLIN